MNVYYRLKNWSSGLEKRWNSQFGKIKFSDFAYQELLSIPALKSFNLLEFMHTFLSDPSLPIQAGPKSKFGNPPLTLFMSSDRSFYLDLYVWPNTHTSAHQHNFEGAFINIQGDSLQTTYTFSPIKSVGESYIGNLKKESIEYIKPYDVKTIRPKNEFIHKVIHIDQPTVTLVLRSKTALTSTPQLNYNFEFLASPSTPSGDKIAKLRCLQYLIECKEKVGFKDIKDIIYCNQTWQAISLDTYTHSLLTKACVYCGRIDFIQKVIKENLFKALLSSLSKKEHFIFLVAYDFDSKNYSHWIKENFKLEYEKEKQDFIKHIEQELKIINISLSKTFLKNL